MFFRLLMESFVRQRRRKALAGVAILLGTTAVTAMLALATTIGDRIHKELAVYGANIVVTPSADQLEVKVGGVSLKPASGGSYLKESDLPKLEGIFWGNNITGVSPELAFKVRGTTAGGVAFNAPAVGLWFAHTLTNGASSLKTGAVGLHPVWKMQGAWPAEDGSGKTEVVVGQGLASRMGLKVGDAFEASLPSPGATGALSVVVSGIVSAGDATDDEILMPLLEAQAMAGLPGAVSRVEISARTKPEDSFARKDPDTLTPKMKEIWYCRPYANSIAYQIREAIPGARAEQVRQVEQSEGSVLDKIGGLMWLVSGAALLAAGFAVSAAMATAVLERRREIGLMRSLGAGKGAIALLFYAETGLLAVAAGTVGYMAGCGLAAWLGARIFEDSGGAHWPGFSAVFIPVLLPVVVGLGLIVAMAGSTPSIRAALSRSPSAILREEG
ncbi:ABC transporter permease [Granulicella sibirica]|uniref:Fe2+ ABC transporter, permease protein 1 n=1 Tax=Granulicella sibirica TaxID=2479048 RepID=A0A4Q0T0H5_9BACT|nr:ABC transporter permease [Granulicella sibirica]RXH55309.1 Fe2+ ABC transporter, permease protein 1 [Granulicella sibirica]